MALDEADNGGLLSGRAAAADDGRRLGGQFHELVLVILETQLQRLAADHQSRVRLAPERVQLLVRVRPARGVAEDVDRLRRNIEDNGLLHWSFILTGQANSSSLNRMIHPSCSSSFI